MKITVAKTAGFCMGVRRAVDMVLDASNLAEEPIYTYGPLIHNPQVLEMLEEKQIFRIKKIPEKGEGIVLIRAHGVPPEDEKSLEDAGFTVINATCPRVVRVQVIINKYAKKGFSTIIIGDKKHPEVVGLLGYAQGRGHAVTTMDALSQLPDFESAVVVAQTTQNTDFWIEIEEWCKNNKPHYKLFDTICGSTERRQSEVRQLADNHDTVVVVGGKESGNTRRLAQIASQTGKPSVHIEDADEIDYENLLSARSIAVTAGASTPNWIIKDTYSKIYSTLQKQHPLSAAFSSVQEFLITTNIMAAAGAGFLTYACCLLQGISRDMHHALIATLYVLSMQIMNNLFTVKSDKYNHPERAHFYDCYKYYLWTLAVISGGCGLYLSFMSGHVAFIVLLIMSVLGLSYNLKIFPKLPGKKQISRIKDIPGSKTILIVLAWGIVTSILPAMVHQNSLGNITIAFVFAVCLVFARTAFFDILAIQGDRITGKETLPILLGEKKSFKIIKYVLITDACLIFAAQIFGLLSKNALLLAFVPLFMFSLIRFFEKNNLVSGKHREFVIESLFIAAGALSALI